MDRDTMTPTVLDRLSPEDREDFLWVNPPQRNNKGGWYVSIAMDWGDSPYSIIRHADTPEAALEEAITEVPRHSRAVAAGREAYERSLGESQP